MVTPNKDNKALAPSRTRIKGETAATPTNDIHPVHTTRTPIRNVYPREILSTREQHEGPKSARWEDMLENVVEISTYHLVAAPVGQACSEVFQICESRQNSPEAMAMKEMSGEGARTGSSEGVSLALVPITCLCSAGRARLDSNATGTSRFTLHDRMLYY